LAIVASARSIDRSALKNDKTCICAPMRGDSQRVTDEKLKTIHACNHRTRLDQSGHRDVALSFGVVVTAMRTHDSIIVAMQSRCHGKKRAIAGARLVA